MARRKRKPTNTSNDWARAWIVCRTDKPTHQQPEFADPLSFVRALKVYWLEAEAEAEAERLAREYRHRIWKFASEREDAEDDWILDFDENDPYFVDVVKVQRPTARMVASREERSTVAHARLAAQGAVPDEAESPAPVVQVPQPVNRAFWSLVEDEPWRAISYLRGAIEQGDWSGDEKRAILHALGWCYYSMGDLPKAGRYFLFCGSKAPEIDKAVGIFRREYGHSAISMLEQTSRCRDGIVLTDHETKIVDSWIDGANELTGRTGWKWERRQNAVLRTFSGPNPAEARPQVYRVGRWGRMLAWWSDAVALVVILLVLALVVVGSITVIGWLNG